LSFTCVADETRGPREFIRGVRDSFSYSRSKTICPARGTKKGRFGVKKEHQQGCSLMRAMNELM